MTDSNEPEGLADKREKRQADRLEQVKRWAEYVASTPADVWGEQQNNVVNSQLDAAQKSGITVDEYKRIERASKDSRNSREPTR